MAAHPHLWRYLTTADDGARLVSEERCELCGRRRKRKYSYGLLFGATCRKRPDKEPNGRPDARTGWCTWLVLLVLAAIMLGLVLRFGIPVPASYQAPPKVTDQGG